MNTLFKAEVVGIEETRAIDTLYNPDGSVADIQPVPHSNRCRLQVKLPDGTVIRAEVSAADFQQHVVPLLSSSRNLV